MDQPWIAHLARLWLVSGVRLPTLAAPPSLRSPPLLLHSHPALLFFRNFGQFGSLCKWSLWYLVALESVDPPSCPYSIFSRLPTTTVSNILYFLLLFSPILESLHVELINHPSAFVNRYIWTSGTTHSSATPNPNPSIWARLLHPITSFPLFVDRKLSDLGCFEIATGVERSL